MENKVKNSYKFFENKDCQYYPCHKEVSELNCLFCYCPLYTFSDCPGNPEFREKNGNIIKVCTNCTFPHDENNYDAIMQKLRDKSK